NDSSRTVWQVLNKQADEGARHDATLGSMHFTSGQLNALGKAKIAMITQGMPEGQQATLYINGPDEQSTKAWQGAVQQYLRDSNIADEAVALRSGGNPSEGEVAFQTLKRTERAESYNKQAAQSGV